MKTFFLLFFTFVFSFLLGSKFPVDKLTSSLQLERLDNPQAIFLFINEYRKSLGQPEFHWAENLCPLADERLSEIQTDFSHQGFWDRGKTIFPTYCSRCTNISENLAKDFFNEQTLVQAWIHSPEHQKSLVFPLQSVCIAVNSNTGSSVLISSY